MKQGYCWVAELKQLLQQKSNGKKVQKVAKFRQKSCSGHSFRHFP